MKRILKKGLISILILFLLVNLISAGISNISYADDFGIGSIFNGLVGLITWIPRAILMALLTGINLLISLFARLGIGEIDGYGTISSEIFVTPFHIFFNRIPILDVNFFNLTGVSGTVLTFRTAVAGWYYTMRLIASMALAVILIYIGIRMAISTIASEKAMYKKMLVDWVTSLALLFLLHYIMIFTFACNEALVNALYDICEDTDLTGFIGQLTLQAIGIDMAGAMAALILYGIIIYQTFSFLFAYVKRMLTIGFLIMIAPLITITYSIDKIGDQKAQALNTWLKEFIYNILIQPFHCILFAAFASVAFKLIGVSELTAGTSIAEMVLAVCCIQFIKTGEDIVKNIFGFKNAQSLSTFVAGTAMTVGALKYGGKAAAVAGSGAAKAKNFIAQNTDKISNVTKSLSNKVGDMSNKFAYTDSKGELTARGRKKLEKETEKRTDKQKQSNSALNNQEKYAEAYQANHDRIEKEMKERYKPKGEKIKEKANKKAEKQESKDRAKAVELATQKLHAKGENRPPNEDEIKSARTQIESERKEKLDRKAERSERRSEKLREISGATGKFWAKNGDKIKAGMLGTATGIIGLGGGFGQAMAGYQIGAGFANGYMKNTDETLQKEVSGSAQAVVNMNAGDEDFDIEAETFRINQVAENGGFEKVQDQLNELLKAISGLRSQKAFASEVSMQLKTNPSQFNMDFLSNMIDKYAEEGADKGEMLSSAQKYASLLAEVNYSQSISTTANTTGRSVADIAEAASNSVNITRITNVTNNETTINEGASEREVREVGTKVDNLNADLRATETTLGSTNEKLNQANQQAQAAQRQTPQVKPPRNNNG